MKLWYHKGKNFGDALNPYIFSKLIPRCLDDDDSTIFIGIGSILGFSQPKNSKKIVFSSGFGGNDKQTYGSVPKLDETYEILCVRGPLTAKALNISPKLALTDGAILLKTIASAAKPVQSNNVGYMPHVGSMRFFDWKQVCNDAGLIFISPEEEVDVVIKKMHNCKLVITEAMHGAIVADTFRIPWIPVVGYPTINEFKWQDWCLSMELNYNPKLMPSIYSNEFRLARLKSRTRKLVPNFIANETLKLSTKKQKERYDTVIGILKSNMNDSGYLSTDSVFDNRLERLTAILDQFSRTHLKN